MLGSTMRLRYVNTSTSLPVDDAQEQHLHRVLGAATKTASFLWDPNVRRLREMSGRVVCDCDVLFVSMPELEDDRREVQRTSRCEEDGRSGATGVDALGLYFPCHPGFGRPLIKVCPEKVMLAGMDYGRQHGVPLGLTRLYPLLLTAVVVHELGHWLMDDRRARRNDPRREWWRVAADDDENWLPVVARRCPGCEPTGHLVDPEKESDHHVVEESLCQALMLTLGLPQEERAALELFVQTAPPPYCAGLAWQMSEEKVLGTMWAWRKHKMALRDPGNDRGRKPAHEGDTTHRLAQSLLAGTRVTEVPDFDH